MYLWEETPITAASWARESEERDRLQRAAEYEERRMDYDAGDLSPQQRRARDREWKLLQEAHRLSTDAAVRREMTRASVTAALREIHQEKEEARTQRLRRHPLERKA